MNKAFVSKMDHYINEYYKNNKNSGCLRITVKDKIVYERFIGYADIENKVEFTNKSKFTLYSLSKPFCAIGLMKLKDKGLIDINLHPGIYLNEAKGFPETLTIKHLLQHTSGIPDFDQNTDFRQKYNGETSEQMKEQLLLLSKYDMLFEPGEKGHYANVNFIICALIIECVSGMSYDEYMKKEVFVPLGMNDTYIDNKKMFTENRVIGYTKKQEDIVPIDRVTEWIMGGADIISTIDDVYCLNKAIKHKLLLNPLTWEEILTPSPINSMGLGCTITTWHNMRRITHNGGWEGFRTLHIQLPEKDFDIIFLSNSAWGDARKDITEAIHKAYFGDDSSVNDAINMDAGYVN